MSVFTTISGVYSLFRCFLLLTIIHYYCINCSICVFKKLGERVKFFMTKRVLNVCVIVFIVLFGLTACGGGGGGAGGGASIPDSDYTTHNPGGWGGGGNSGGHNSGSENGGTNVTTQGGTPLVVNSFRYQGVTCSNPPDELVRMWHDDEKTGTFYAEFFCNNEPNPRQVRVV